jgi:hypothetical protein
MNMKKLVTKTDKEKKEKRNKILMGVFLALIMIASTAGFAFFSSDNTETKKTNYNGRDFQMTESGYWGTKISNTEFYFYYSPVETEQIDSPVVSSTFYHNSPLFIVSDTPEATSELARTMINFAPRVQEACFEGEEENCRQDLPIKNCDENLILIRTANITKITKYDNCVFIEAEAGEQTKAVDAFLYRLLGVR